MSHGVDPGHVRDLYRQMLRIRRFEERCVELYSATKIRGFLHLYIGEEAVAVGVNQAHTERDAVVATTAYCRSRNTSERSRTPRRRRRGPASGRT